MHRAAPNGDGLNAQALQRMRDQTPAHAPPQNVWRVLNNKAALNAGKSDEASYTQPAGFTGVRGEKVAMLHTVTTCPNQTDAGKSKAVAHAVHLKPRSMSDIEGSELVLSIEDIR